MLSRLILILLQIVVAWVGAPLIYKYIPSVGFGLFIYAVLFAILVYLTGVLAAQVLKDVGTRSSAALTASLIVALLAAAFVTFGPEFIPQIPKDLTSQRAIVLAGAILGYLARR
jgi:uncharacterized membrane protein YoaK (UPF0700 family)